MHGKWPDEMNSDVLFSEANSIICRKRIIIKERFLKGLLNTQNFKLVKAVLFEDLASLLQGFHILSDKKKNKKNPPEPFGT